MPDTIAQRVTRYLTRHIAFLEESLASLHAINFEEPDALEAFALAQAKRDSVGRQLDLEQAALLKEWRATGTNDAPGHEAVAALARRAEELAAQLLDAYDAAGARAQQSAAAVRTRMNAARRGAGMAGRFASDTAEDSGGSVDRQA